LILNNSVNNNKNLKSMQVMSQ